MPQLPVDPKTHALINGKYVPIGVAPVRELNYIIPPDSQPTGTRKATPRASRPAKPGAHPNRKGVAAWQIFDLIRSQREQASEQIPEEPANKRRSRGGVAGRVREMQQVRDASNKRN